MRSLGPYINYFNFWDFSSIKSLVGDLKLIFPIIFRGGGNTISISLNSVNTVPYSMDKFSKTGPLPANPRDTRD